MKSARAENAELDLRFWETTHSFGESIIHDHNGLKASTERAIAKLESNHAESTALLDAAKEYGKTTNSKWLMLQTAADNFTAQALYKKNGWKKETDLFYRFDL